MHEKENRWKVSTSTKIHCFFSGGRDSALACVIAKKVADIRNWKYVLVNIDTTIGLTETKKYVEQYAKWLGAELIRISPERSFKEYAEKIGMWPSLYPQKYRWCYYMLKLQPMTKYIKENYKENDLIVMGIRKNESKFRSKHYTHTFFIKNYNGIKAQIWAPLLFINEITLTKLIEHYSIPKSPVWKYGFSGECLCLAGAPIHEIATILRQFPKERNLLLEIDDIINRNRKGKKPSAPFRVAQAGYKTLRDFYEQTVKNQLTLDDFLIPYSKSCEGTCML